MDRRQFIRVMAAAGAGAALASTQGCETGSGSGETVALPAVRTSAFSTEIVLNSRRSYHSGFAGGLPEQVLSNVLRATGRAPLAGGSRTIYAALPDNVYRYDPARHELVLHLAGNHLSLAGLGFEVGIVNSLTEDAGVASQFGLLAATAFWADTSDQPGTCPSASAAENATNSWGAGAVTFASSYGLMGSVRGMTSELVAVSSDGSLPAPATTGATIFEDAVEAVDYGTSFASGDLAIGQLAQLAWASYGNTPHLASNGNAALACPSSQALYYLTGRIYIVRSVGTERSEIRLPGGSATTRDHRIERVIYGDRRPALRSAVTRIPQTAPVYFVYCGASGSRAELLESGFAAGGAVLQATSSGLRSSMTAGLSAAERTAVAAALGLPSGDLPLLVLSAGAPGS